MNVLVFGATGFLGSVLVRKLVRNGFFVSVLTRDKERAKALLGQDVTVHVGDMVDGIYPKLSDYDVVINCAGEIKNEALMRRLHVDAISDALRLLTAENKTQWIQISSVGVYGPQNVGVVREGHPFNPIGEYEVTKAEGEILVHKICRANGVPYTIILPSNVFGIGMPNQSLSQLIHMIRCNVFFFIGNPELCMMNYVYIDDVVDTIIACMENPNAINNDFIVSDVIDQRAFVQLVKSEVGGGWTPVIPEPVVRTMFLLARFIHKFPLSVGRLNALTNRAVYSVEKIKYCLGFAPKVGSQDGLRQYCKHLKQSWSFSL
jgi:nucleoside-diphosphate-sugar epimerase